MEPRTAYRLQGRTCAFQGRSPRGSYQNFITGFWLAGREHAEVWGRPAAIAVAKDGSLLIADDTAGTIWRVAYTGKSASQTNKTRVR
jgi:glucose/arabinose dehydrogenase